MHSLSCLTGHAPVCLQQSYRKAVTTARRDKKGQGRAAGLTEEQKQEIRFALVLLTDSLNSNHVARHWTSLL